MGIYSRRLMLKSASALAGTWAAGSIGHARAQSNTIKLGIVCPMSGTQILNGMPLQIGAQVARDHINKAGGINGRMIELVTRDDKADPNQTVAFIRELNSDGVNLFLGASITGPALAAAPVVRDLNSVLIIQAVDDRLTHEVYNPHLFMGGTNAYTRVRALARVMVDKFPKLNNWGAVFPDISVGHGSWDQFSKGLKEYYPKYAHHDVTILDPVLSKFGATDFKDQVGKLSSLPIEGMFNLEYGSDGITFFKQAQQFGLTPKLKAIADQGLDIAMGKTLGQATPSADWALSFWWPYAYPEIPESEELRHGYEVLTGDAFPTGIAAFGYTSVKAYAAAIAAAGNTTTESVISALENVKVQTVKGTVYYRKEDHQVIDDVLVLNLAPKDTAPFWQVANIAKLNGAEVVNPPNPGKPL